MTAPVSLSRVAVARPGSVICPLCLSVLDAGAPPCPCEPTPADVARDLRAFALALREDGFDGCVPILICAAALVGRPAAVAEYFCPRTGRRVLTRAEVVRELREVAGVLSTLDTSDTHVRLCERAIRFIEGSAVTP